jgi:hypothetical protein
VVPEEASRGKSPLVVVFNTLGMLVSSGCDESAFGSEVPDSSLKCSAVPGEETVHVTVKRRNASAIACDCDRAYETRRARVTACARAARALPIVRPGEKAKPAGMPLAANKCGGKIRVGHVRASQGCENAP